MKNFKKYKTIYLLKCGCALLFLFGLTPSNLLYGQTDSSVFITIGPSSWTPPEGVCNATVKCWGAGGGGGWASGGGGAGGGGGGGGFSSNNSISVEPSTHYAIHVGAGGVGGDSAALTHAGSMGGSSTFNSTVVVANGGSGGGEGALLNLGTLGIGASTGTGTITYEGGNGSAGTYTLTIVGSGTKGAGGGCGGTTGNGGNASGIIGGTGAAYGGGNGANGSSVDSVGANGITYGGGGSGGLTESLVTTKVGAPGGNGANGAVVISWTVPTDAQNITFSNVQCNQMTVSWTNGNNLGRMLVAKAGSAISGTPNDGFPYTANPAFGSGNYLLGGYVVYYGNGNSVTVSNLNGGTTYYFEVFEYNNCTSIYPVYLSNGEPTNSETAAGITVNYSVTPDNGTCNGSATVTATGGTAPYTYLWSGGQTYDTILNKCANTYCCTVSDNNGCTDSICAIIPLFTGINGLSGTSRIHIYPDPTTGKLNISNVNTDGMVDIYNSLGQLILHSTSAKDNVREFNISAQPNGIYLIRIMKQDGTLLIQRKIIKTS
jgi:hypothetical protein